MSNPNGHGGRRPGAGRPKSKSRLLREAAEQLLRDLPHFRLPRQSADQVVEQLGRLTATVHRLREDQRSDRENLLPILRRLDRDRAIAVLVNPSNWIASPMIGEAEIAALGKEGRAPGPKGQLRK